jgi:DNA (cytosine-5)-methyltransferase 1
MTLRSNRPGRSRKSLRVVSLYTGAGGLDFGFEAAGFRTCVAVEFDQDCCRTLRANRSWPVIEKDIHATTGKEIMDAGGLRRCEADLLLGGPPCQPFSKSGYWVNGDTKRLQDPRGLTLHQYMRCVDDLLPRVFVLENVHGISYSGKEEGFQLLAKLTAEINRRHRTNYVLSWKVLNTADYGVPQIRQRFFLVAHREGGKFEFPRPSHTATVEESSKRALFPYSTPEYVTAWDAIGKLRPSPKEDLRVKGYWAELLHSIPEGENYLWHTHRKGGLPLFGWRTRYWSFLLKLAKNKPSWTIQAQPGPAIGPFHWENRLLSVREMAALQTFPADVRLIGSRRSIQRQLGNAVPSLIAEILAREIKHQLFDISAPSQLQLVVKLNRPIPPPQRVGKVPLEYVRLVGDHADHPGEGMGPMRQGEISQPELYR